MRHVRAPRWLRVLLVPGSVQWIQGTKARAIADANPWIEPTILSEGVIRRLFPDGEGLLRNIDLVHFLWQSSYDRIGHLFMDRMPCVCAIAHIDDWERSRVASTADAVMYVSSEWRDEMVRHGVEPDRLHHLRNGADTEVFRPVSGVRKRALRRAIGLPSDAFVVGFVAKRSSNVGDRKGLDMFMRGIRRLHARMGSVVPLIIGPGWGGAVRQLRREGITPVWLHFLPDRREFANVYQCMDVFWITARREGGPATLLEAMASEVCCLTTPVGMVRDVVRDGENAVLVAHGDADALVRISVELAGSPISRRRIGRRARQTILHGYQWKQTGRRAAELYAAAIRRFFARTGRRLRQDLLAAIDPAARPRHAATATSYLSAVPSRLRGRVQAAETGQWMRHMARMGDRGAVARCGVHAAAQQPSNAYSWLELIRVIAGLARRR